jgi:hypothetical protein
VKTIKSYLLQEHFPEKPDTVVFRNKYYPQGLTEGMIYNYYMKMKPQILSWIKNRQVMFFIRIDQNQVVVKRKMNGSDIILTSSNYEQLINGRLNQIHVEHPNNTNYFVVDIDAGNEVSYRNLYKASVDLEKLTDPMGVVKWEKLFSGPRGIHAIGYLKGRRSLSVIREELVDLLNTQDKYLVNVKGRRPGTINFDMTPNYKRGSHIARFSLTKDGLICDDILNPNSQAGQTI